MNRISYSRLSMWMKCAFQMHGKYNLGIRGSQSPAAARGSAVHTNFENAVQLQLPLPEEFAFYDEYIKKLVGSQCELKLAVDRNWQPMEADAADAWLCGIIDLWNVQGTRATLLDWKTGKEYPDHVQQKEFYTALAADFHPEVEVFDTINVYVDLKKISSHKFTREEVSNLRERWGRRAELMEKDTEYAPSPGPYCRWCDVSQRRGGPCTKG